MEVTMDLQVLALVFMYVHHASCQQQQPSAECQEVVKAAVAYRDHLKEQQDRSEYKATTRGLTRNFRINLESDADIEEFLCAIADSEPKTISNIAKATPEFMDERQLAFAYTSLLSYLEGRIQPYADEVSHFERVLEFTEVTGFPTFPLKLNQSELSQYIREADSRTIARIFDYPIYAGIDHRGAAHVFYAVILKTLSDSTSLEDFARRTYIYLQRRSSSKPKHEISVDSAADSIMQKLLLSSSAQEPLRALQERMNLKPDYIFLNALAKSGFLNVTRGGPELYSCDFIANKTVEAVDLVMELQDRRIVLMSLSVIGLYPYREDDLKSLVCSVLKAKSKQELAALVPGRVFTEYGGFEAAYRKAVSYGQFILVQPYGVMSTGMHVLRVIEAVETAGFPDFPLAISTEQAKQLAALIKQLVPDAGDMQTLAQNIQDADSLDYFLLGPLFRAVVGKSDIVLKLASSLYQLLMSVEEQGVFMLPDT